MRGKSRLDAVFTFEALPYAEVNLSQRRVQTIIGMISWELLKVQHFVPLTLRAVDRVIFMWDYLSFIKAQAIRVIHTIFCINCDTLSNRFIAHSFPEADRVSDIKK